ncbi:RNA-binding protein, partial [archaeon]
MTSASVSLYVQNIPAVCEETDLWNLFSPFGHVLGVEVFGTMTGRGDRRPSKAATVLFASGAQAWEAYSQLNGSRLFGESIRIAPPQPSGGTGGPEPTLGYPAQSYPAQS